MSGSVTRKKDSTSVLAEPPYAPIHERRTVPSGDTTSVYGVPGTRWAKPSSRFARVRLSNGTVGLGAVVDSALPGPETETPTKRNRPLACEYRLAMAA
jgi:hypothetical protein